MDGRPPGSNPFHPSRGPLAAILPLFPRRFEFPIPLDLDLLLMSGEHVETIQNETAGRESSLEIPRVGAQDDRRWSNSNTKDRVVIPQAESNYRETIRLRQVRETNSVVP